MKQELQVRVCKLLADNPRLLNPHARGLLHLLVGDEGLAWVDEQEEYKTALREYIEAATQYAEETQGGSNDNH